MSKINDNTAWETLHFVIYIIQHIRNSGDKAKGQDDKFLLSPIRSENYDEHYDSRNLNGKLPIDADANGAFNIARKGLWVIDQIKHTADLKKLKLAITNKEWLAFAKKKYNCHFINKFYICKT